MRQIISQSLSGLWPILLFCAACHRDASRLTPAKYDQVTTGMSKAQVEKVLGPPTKVETKQALVLTGESRWQPKTTYRYEEGTKFATITFKDDQVDGKDSNLGRGP